MGNFNKIGKISPIKQEYVSEGGVSMAVSLSRAGLNRTPGTVQALTPFREKDGSYRTGLDDNAAYIRAMENEGRKDEADQERERVRGFLEHVKSISGIDDLGPRSEYYTKMYHEGFFRTQKVASPFTLRDGINTFDLSDPFQAITYFWLRVHPTIAPSYDAYITNTRSFRCPLPLEAKWYIEEEEVQTKIAYTKSIRINKAIAQLDNMLPTKRLKIAKLLGLPVSHMSSDDIVYVELDQFIKAETGGTKTQNLTMFESMLNVADENLEIKYIVAQAIEYRIYTIGKGGIIYRGKTQMANSEDELVAFLSNPMNQEELLAVKVELEQKEKTILKALG